MRRNFYEFLSPSRWKVTAWCPEHNNCDLTSTSDNDHEISMSVITFAKNIYQDGRALNKQKLY